MFASRPHPVGHILAANNTTHLIANHTPETIDRDRKRSDYCWFNSFFERPAVAVIAAGEVPRVQTVWRQHDGFPHALLCRFEGLTGVPVLINTSLNLGGKPIVESRQDALACLYTSEMDFLVLVHLLEKSPSVRLSTQEESAFELCAVETLPRLALSEWKLR